MKDLKGKRGKVLARKLQRFFITTVIGGLVVVLPLTIFVFLVRLVFQLIFNVVAPIGSLFSFPESVKEWIVNLVALAVVILIFFLIGLFVRTNFGNQLFAMIERDLFSRLPFYNTLRETVRQLIGTNRTPFGRVVLVDVFGTKTKMTGFITDELGNDMYTVFVPTTPNPTNGFLFHCHISQIEFLENIKSEDALRTIIAIGSGSNLLFKQQAEKNNP